MISLLKSLNPVLTSAGETAYSLLRVIAGISIVRIPPQLRSSDNCLVLGNGPSLKEVVESISCHNVGMDTLCVNFFANDPHFSRIKPRHYVLLDPMFWVDGLPPDVLAGRNSLFCSLFDRTDWRMNLYLPAEARKVLKGYNNANICVTYYNRTPVVGFQVFRHLCYRLNLGMPVPQNVLVAALFLAIQLKYKKVYILGADHSWHRELVVGDDNILYVKQIHFNENDVAPTPFYKPGEKEIFKLHEIFQAWSRLFRSYCQLQSYAKESGTSILNSSTGSFIDAFERESIQFSDGKNASDACHAQ